MTPDEPLTGDEIDRIFETSGLLETYEPLTAEEDLLADSWTPVVLPPGSPGSEVLVDEDRGPR